MKEKLGEIYGKSSVSEKEQVLYDCICRFRNQEESDSTMESDEILICKTINDLVESLIRLRTLRNENEMQG